MNDEHLLSRHIGRMHTHSTNFAFFKLQFSFIFLSNNKNYHTKAGLEKITKCLSYWRFF